MISPERGQQSLRGVPAQRAVVETSFGKLGSQVRIVPPSVSGLSRLVARE